MRVGIFGFGKAGRSAATVFLQNPGTVLEWVVRRSAKLEHRSVPEFLGISSTEPGLIYSREEFTAAELFDRQPVDVIVDFSADDCLDYYGEEAAERDIAIVTAISHCPRSKIALLRRLARRTPVLWSPNITIGINFLMLASKVLKKIAPYTDIEILEEHFKGKTGASGTAKRIAKYLGISSARVKKIRAGGIIGTHEVLFGFPFQTIRLKHESISREAFGDGALFAAENLFGKKRGFYTMEDLLLPYFAL